MFCFESRALLNVKINNLINQRTKIKLLPVIFFYRIRTEIDGLKQKISRSSQVVNTLVVVVFGCVGEKKKEKGVKMIHL